VATPGGKLNILNKKEIFMLNKFYIIEPNERKFSKCDFLI
jgi:hypothetical protein